MGIVLLWGPHKWGHYECLSRQPSLPPSSLSTSIFSSVKVSLEDWQHHFGHPSNWILCQVVSSYSLPTSSFNKFNCNSWKCNKPYEFPFKPFN